MCSPALMTTCPHLITFSFFPRLVVMGNNEAKVKIRAADETSSFTSSGRKQTRVWCNSKSSPSSPLDHMEEVRSLIENFIQLTAEK